MKNLSQNLRDFADKFPLLIKQFCLGAFVIFSLSALSAFGNNNYLKQGQSFFERMLVEMKTEVAETLTETNTISQTAVNQLLSIQMVDEIIKTVTTQIS